MNTATQPSKAARKDTTRAEWARRGIFMVDVVQACTTAELRVAKNRVRGFWSRLEPQKQTGKVRATHIRLTVLHQLAIANCVGRASLPAIPYCR